LSFIPVVAQGVPAVPQALSMNRRLPGGLFPFLAWIGELLHAQRLLADVVAGITVALV
jgi:hypothetical protein